MALTYSDLEAATHPDFDKVLIQHVYENSAFLMMLKSKKKLIKDGGSKLTWPLRYKKLSDADAVDTNKQIVFSRKQTRTRAEENWKKYTAHAMITWDEEIQAVGKNQIIDLVKDKYKELK